MRPLAQACGFAPERVGVWRWDEDEREELRAELDAAYFLLYGYSREDVDYVLGTFQGIVDEDEKLGGLGQKRRRILELYDAMGRGLFD